MTFEDVSCLLHFLVKGIMLVHDAKLTIDKGSS